MRFSQAELQAYRGGTLPDLLPSPLRLLFVGINPSLWSVAVGAHFARRGNRFYPALAAAGITREVIDASSGYPEQGLAELNAAGVGITNIVAEASARADELSTEQIRHGADDLVRRIAIYRPSVVAILGITAYRVGFRQPKAVTGEQPPLEWAQGSSRLFVLPNPSGLNAHESVASLGAAFRQAGEAAGIVGANGSCGDA